ncbi:MAG: DtxR family transcriptional regulator [Pseudomonadota bacterium]
MTRQSPQDLSSSQEDYLETILAIAHTKGEVSISEIASQKGVSLPSAHSAVGKLATLGLVSHDTYGKVELTPVGKQAAQAIAKRHVLLERFLTDVLLVNPDIAEKDACSIEHHLSPATIKALVSLFDFLEGLPDGGRHWLGELHRNISSKREKPLGISDTLNRIAPGETVNVIKIMGTADLRRHLIEMGITAGCELYVQRVAPLGDPMAVDVNGISLSLRKQEASQIVVEKTHGARGRSRRRGLRERHWRNR